MKVIVASTSEFKVNAVKEIFCDATVSGVQTDSGVHEQPINAETLLGVTNRMMDAQNKEPGADFYVSIENGLFEEDGRYIDKAVVMIADSQGEVVSHVSEGVEFPKNAFLEAQKRGLDKVTVGKVMAELGIVRLHNDPHADLGKKIPRKELLVNTIKEALDELKSLSQQNMRP